MVDRNGTVKWTSDKPIPGNANASFGWGGGLALADMDLDGHPEVVFGSTVFSQAPGGGGQAPKGSTITLWVR